MTSANDTTHDADLDDLPIAPEELRLRVIYSLLRPVVRLAGVFGLPLQDIKEWLGVAYLHELKRRGLTQVESAKHIGVSRRTIISLSRKLRDNFFAPERHEGVERRILFMLWAEPMPLGRIRQALDGEADDEACEQALEKLLAAGAISSREYLGTTHYELNRSEFRLYKDNWIGRIDALNNQLDHIGDTVFARFFKESPLSFARTVTLSICEEDVPELERLYREVIFPELVRLDERASACDGEVEAMELSLSWAPKNFMTTSSTLTDTTHNGEQDD